jgi:hypothetical protein
MNIQVDFGIVVVILLIIGNEVSQVKRKVNELDEKLGHLQTDLKLMRDGISFDLNLLRDHIDRRFEYIGVDLKNVQSSLEYDIKTNLGDKLEGKLDDILEKLDEVSDKLPPRDVRR